MKNVFRISLLISLLLSLVMVRPALSQIATLLKVRIVDYSGGQVSKNYADQLTNAQGALIQNAEINTKGQLSTRLGQS